ncbi:hypothetical protein ALP94_03912 [Pseudomonas savastanoi pv. glycinea]|uniref:hypothetical protein n=1 Tax=Pseudomonas quasicaspiana TaxID=2829821 RepID=UPI000F001EDA|nr:hypothetical protein [Pseudomonas quasicaspiana]MCD5976779.1 hypothetical protein [Pseudomonas quasicaspiana]RMQ98667.1 hypothetical protein ALP94_03912 [Pseudomonas savastanoi pv. glycinea]
MAVREIREKYLELAESLFPIIAAPLSQRLSATINLASISEAELKLADLWVGHPGRRVEISWREIMYRHRKTPKRIDVAFYCADVLCGMMIATISKARVNVNMTYVEANPDPSHPLKSNFLLAATLQAELFAQLIGAKSTSISKPDRNLIDAYKTLKYRPVSADRTREEKGMRPRYAQLIKRFD